MSVPALTRTWLAATLCFAVSALLPAAARATHFPSWQNGDENDEVPATVSLKDVAAISSVVVAVGEQATGGGKQAVVYRRRLAAGGWVADNVSVTGLPAGATGATLEDVAVSSNAAWAVGTYQDGTGTHPLVLRLVGGDAALAGGTPASWQPPTDTGNLLSGTSTPHAVALRGTVGLIGTSEGKVYPVTDPSDGSGGTIQGGIDPTPGPAQQVNGVSLYNASEGYAVTNATGGSSPSTRIYKVQLASGSTPASMSPVPVLPGDSTNRNVIAVSADELANQALAVEENPDSTQPGTWAPGAEGLSWSRKLDKQLTGDSHPSDVSIEVPTTGGSITAAIAGVHAGAGAVWRSDAQGGWIPPENVSSAPLTGVAVLDQRNIWAVGDAGTIVHYAPQAAPPEPDTQILAGPDSTTDDDTPTFAFTSDQDGASFECRLDGGGWFACTSPYTTPRLGEGQHSFEVRAIGVHGTDPTPAGRTFTVDLPEEQPLLRDSTPPPPLPPETQILAAPGATTDDDTPTFIFASDQDGASFECRLDGGGWPGCVSPHTTSPLAEGRHTFEVRATTANGTDPTPAGHTFTVDPPDRRGHDDGDRCRKASRKRLVNGIRVHQRPGKLIVSFRVEAKARVKVIAKRDGEVVGRTPMRTMRKGNHKLRVRVQRKPDKLRVIAKPARKCPKQGASTSVAPR